MKVIANGGLNFSILDGWWDEAYQYNLGWTIGNAEEYADIDYQDEVEARLIYETLEKEIIPLFYERGEDKLPRRWIEFMKNSMKNLGPFFNTNRMVREYSEKYYFNAEEKRKLIFNNNCEYGKTFTEWKSNLFANWEKVKFCKIDKEVNSDELKVGAKYIINAEVELGNLKHSDVKIQIYYGKVDDWSVAHSNKYFDMEYVANKSKGGIHNYIGEIECNSSGQYGFTLRILPNHPLLINPFELGLIRWAK